MSEPKKKLSRAEAWDALAEMSVLEDVESVLAQSEGRTEAELRASGLDPAALRAKGEGLGRAREAGRSTRPAARGVVVPLRRRWGTWVGASGFAAAAAAMWVLVESAGPTLVGSGAPEAGAEPLGPQAERLRERAIVDCAYGRLARCEAELDEARRIDPAGEEVAPVARAREILSRAAGDAGRD